MHLSQPNGFLLDHNLPFFALALDFDRLAAYTFYVRSWVQKAT